LEHRGEHEAHDFPAVGGAQYVGALVTEPGHPPVGALARHTEFLRDMRDWALLLDDPFDE